MGVADDADGADARSTFPFAQLVRHPPPAQYFGTLAVEYRWAERAIRSAAGTSGRVSASTSSRDGHGPWSRGGACGQGGDFDDPHVFTISDDPVRLGLVASLAWPGGNVTGINFVSGELVAKRLELLRELVPGAARVVVLVNPANAVQTESTLRDVDARWDCKFSCSMPTQA